MIFVRKLLVICVVDNCSAYTEAFAALENCFLQKYSATSQTPYPVEISLVSSLINWCKYRSVYSQINMVPLYCTRIVYLWEVKIHKRATTKG